MQPNAIQVVSVLTDLLSSVDAVSLPLGFKPQLPVNRSRHLL